MFSWVLVKDLVLDFFWLCSHLVFMCKLGWFFLHTLLPDVIQKYAEHTL
jgi:hypothetical protein